MALLARSALRASVRVAPVAKSQVRGVHFENVVGKTIPTSVNNKPFLLMKVAGFTIAGFGTPFAVAAWHLRKSGATADAA